MPIPRNSLGGSDLRLSRNSKAELEQELETAARFIRRMQETEEDMTRQVRDLVAQKNDAVLALSHWQGRVAGLEAENARLIAEKESAMEELTSLRRAVTHSRQEQFQFEERVLEKAKGECQDILLQKVELEGRLASSEARLKPMTKQVEQLQSENHIYKIDRDEQEDLISDLHTLVREIQQEREAIVAAAELERKHEQETRFDLERDLETETEKHGTAVAERDGSRKSAGFKMMREMLHQFRSKSLKNAMVSWEVNFLNAKSQEALEEAAEETEVAKAGSGMRMVREAFKQWLKDAAIRAVSNWRLNQLDSEGKTIESQKLLLGEQLAVAKALEASRIREHERLQDENKSLSYQLKEATREKQVLFMEVENLKAVGEQLVSELVITAAEVSEEFKSFRASDRKEFDGPVALTVSKMPLNTVRDSIDVERPMSPASRASVASSRASIDRRQPLARPPN